MKPPTAEPCTCPRTPAPLGTPRCDKCGVDLAVVARNARHLDDTFTVCLSCLPFFLLYQEHAPRCPWHPFAARRRALLSSIAAAPESQLQGALEMVVDHCPEAHHFLYGYFLDDSDKPRWRRRPR